MTTINELLSDSRNSGQYRILNTLKPLFDDIESRLSSGGSGSSSGSSATFPIIYGGSAATSTLTLVSTSHASPSGSSGNTISFKTSGISRWTISRSGDFVPDTNNSYSIGEQTSSIANIYLGGDIRFVDGSDYLKITRGTNSLLFGSSTYALNNTYIGQGQTTTTPGTYAIRATGATGATVGGTIQIAGGVSGNSATNGGQIDLRTSCATGPTADGTTLRTRWSVVSAGHFIPFDTCTYDIGDSTHTVRNIYLCTNLKFRLSTRYGNIRWPLLSGVGTADLNIDIPDTTTISEVDGKIMTTNFANKFVDGLGSISHIEGPDDGSLKITSPGSRAINLEGGGGLDINGEVRFISSKLYENNELVWKIENFVGITLASDHAFNWSSTSDAVNDPPDAYLTRQSTGVISISDDGSNRLLLDGYNYFIRFGNTSSDMAIKKSSTALHVRLGDDSAYAPARMSTTQLNSGSLIADTGDGIIRLSNAAANDFSRLMFGGSTSSFPALKRSGTSIAFRLADDSAYSVIEMAASQKWLSGSGTPESSVTSAIGGMYLRTDGSTSTTLYIKTSGSGNTGWTAVNPSGGSISGTENRIVKFGAGGSGAADSLLYDDGVLIQFEGQDSTYPGLKRNGTTIDVRLADDSAYTWIAAASFRVSDGTEGFLDGERLKFSNIQRVEWSSSTSSADATDTGIIRSAAGVVKTYDGSSTDYFFLDGPNLMVKFGGTSSSFPALKRSTTTIQSRLADDSGYAAFTGGTFTSSTGTYQSTGANVLVKGEDGNTARSVTIRGSDAASGSNNGGNVIIRPGALSGAGTNGTFDLQTGGGTSRLAISTAGAVTAAGTWTHSGTIAFTLADGTKQITGPTTGGTGLFITGGDRSTSGNGNVLELYAGAANTTGAGGSINIYAMDGVGSNQNGGSITLSAGVKTGAGTEGAINIGISTNRLGFFGVTAVARASAYTVTNGSTDRSYDANSTTLDEIADVVSTIIADLKNYGLFQ